MNAPFAQEFVLTHPVTADRWRRTLCLTASGQAFLPAAAVGAQNVVMARAVNRRTVNRKHDGHWYLPVDYLRREYPDALDWVAITALVERLRARMQST